MPVITMDRVESAKTVVDSMIERGQTLFEDITETASELARLYKEAEQRERDISEAHHETSRLQARVDQLESMLDSVRATVDMVKPGVIAREAPTSIVETNGPITRDNLTEMRRTRSGQGMMPRVDPINPVNPAPADRDHSLR